MKILYVEDNPANLFLVKRVARIGGHEVINYIDGEDALRNFDKDAPDLVLMDIELAGDLTGIDVIRDLRKQGHTVPIVAVTAYAMVGDREKCIEAGCDAYIAKPIPIPELVSVIARYNSQSEMIKEEKPATSQPKPEAVSRPPLEMIIEEGNGNQETEVMPASPFGDGAVVPVKHNTANNTSDSTASHDTASTSTASNSTASHDTASSGENAENQSKSET